MADTNEKWLTLEQAAKQIKLNEGKLKGCLNSSQPVMRFQTLGLLFDKDRKANGEPFLQLLEAEKEESKPSPVKVTSTVSKSDKDDIEKRSYAWEETPITLQLKFLPVNEGQDRQVLIVATTYTDFSPMMMLISESDLGKLPPVLRELLQKLKDDLPRRKAAYDTAPKKAEPKPTTTVTTTVARSSAPSQSNKKPDPTPTPIQIQFF